MLDIVSNFSIYRDIDFFRYIDRGGGGASVGYRNIGKNGISEYKKTKYRYIEKNDVSIWGGRGG